MPGTWPPPATSPPHPRPKRAADGAATVRPDQRKLGLLGQEPVDAPPVAPQFSALAPQGLVITNTAGVVAVKLTCLGDPGETRCCGPARRRTRRFERAVSTASSAAARRRSPVWRTLRRCTRLNSVRRRLRVGRDVKREA
jgi:hypothetical protein